MAEAPSLCEMKRAFRSTLAAPRLQGIAVPVAFLLRFPRLPLAQISQRMGMQTGTEWQRRSVRERDGEVSVNPSIVVP